MVAVEIKVTGAVQTSQTLILVFNRVGMDNIHNHRDAELMGVVDKALKVFGSSETRRGGKETRHMIAERPVVGMLLDSHNLDGVITVGGNAGEHLVAEFLVCPHTLTLLCHTDMAFIDKQRAGVGHEIVDIPFERGVVPHLRREDMCVLILHHTVGISRDTQPLPPVPMHAHLIELPVMHHIGRDMDFPDPVFQRVQRKLGPLLPTGEITYQENLPGIGRPFAENPPVTLAVKPEILVRIGEILQRIRVGSEFGFLPDSICMTPLDGICMRCQPRVIAIECKRFLFHISMCFCLLCK